MTDRLAARPADASDDAEVARLARALDDLARQLARVRDEGRLLASVTEQVSRGVFLEGVLERVYASFHEVLPYDRIGFAALTHGGTRVTAQWARSRAARIELPSGYGAPLAGSSLAEVLEAGQPRIIDDLERHLRLNPGSDSTRRLVAEGMRSSLTCPIVALGKPVGFLFFTSMQRAAYRPEHVELFMRLSTQLAVTLEKSRLSEQLLAERARSKGLVRAVLPGAIAERLEAGERSIAEEAEATVLFADLVGFSRLAAAVPPDVLVAFLDDLFGQLDQVAARHGVEKIKTIGDAYLAAAGVPDGRPDHARAAAEMALEAMALLRGQRRPDGERVALRIGLHTGPVVAGVIGRSRLAYDLWGDTVNVARRMEELGLPGRIQVSEATRLALGDAYRLEPSGELPMKTGGTALAHWLCGRVERAARGAA